MDIGNQIKKFRTNLQLSQEMVAEKMCVSRQTVSNWETQKSYPDIHRLLQLGALFKFLWTSCSREILSACDSRSSKKR